MSRLDAAHRNRLPAHAFAWPERRELPIYDRSHIKPAASRLSMMVHNGTVGPSLAVKIHGRIVRAGRRFGIHVGPMHHGRHHHRSGRLLHRR